MLSGLLKLYYSLGTLKSAAHTVVFQRWAEYCIYLIDYYSTGGEMCIFLSLHTCLCSAFIPEYSPNVNMLVHSGGEITLHCLSYDATIGLQKISAHSTLILGLNAENYLAPCQVSYI